VAGQGKIAARRRPLVRIGHSLKLLLVGASHRRTRYTHHQRDERAGCGTKLEVPHVLLLSLASSWFGRGLALAIGEDRSPCELLNVTKWMREAVQDTEAVNLADARTELRAL
jgi:hypothetical protein